MNLFCEFDKAGAEWVIVAYLSGDSNMLSVVESGKSPHVVTGALMSGLSEEAVIAENKIIGSKTDPDEILSLRQEHMPEIFHQAIFLPRTMSIRQGGKKSNHGLNYDMKYRRYALENEIEDMEAKKAVELYRTKAYPGIPIWHEATRRQLRKNRTLINCFGRKRVFLEQWGQDMFDAAYAYVPQSTVFDITAQAMRIIRREQDEGVPYELLAQVHDSILIQHFDVLRDPRGWAENCIRIALDYMNPVLYYGGREFQLGTTLKVGVNWGQEAMHEVQISRDVDKTLEGLLKAVERAEDDLAKNKRLD